MKQARELVKAADIAAMNAVRSVHTLNPNAIRLKKSVGDMAGLTQLGAHIITLMPGHESSEYHRHLYEEECLYVLSGQGEAQIDEQAYAIGTGDFLGFARKGPAHVIVNTGSEPLMFLVVGQRLEQDVCDYPRKGVRLYVAGDDESYVKL
ncbi:cupin domain-containing protein [Dyella nitratireducens]|uniref:Cupin n=1 Tax=Dyella nitratireducens TaxID=1849580 RepID=A0ABQ1FMK0_9GAMM|nr:cupin domain-containing protein [Dyella nitratireducens]GGA19981.1 cupin [Dyella nitratireducens]GLQ44437.1 cupin [Dyella nitratireducens]